ncbi:Endo-1 [Escovopsis weberi]|uniref:Endo-1 n=1 Tax=Escovopsis weberi TaxID=150374 RepID=A0A0M9VUT2_ESCWE|nr:Endo-1 [Escovopsis weberi]
MTPDFTMHRHSNDPSGAHFSLMRHTIGASDLSGDTAYTYDHNGGAADPTLAGFDLGDRGRAMASLLARMRGLNADLRILGSPEAQRQLGLGAYAMAWTLGTDAADGPHLSTSRCATCTGLVTVNGADSYTLQTAYYMVAQFSRFMTPGGTVLGGTGSRDFSDGGIQSVASLNPDGSKTVVIQNTFGNDVFVSVFLKSDQEWSGNVPASSVTT